MENDNPYSSLSANQVLSTGLIREILEIPSVEIREHSLVLLENRAKDLKIMKNLSRLEKSVQAEIQQDYKQHGAKETNITRQPIKLKVPCDYICDDLGVRIEDYDAFTRKTNERIVCPHPLLPIERLINIDTNVEKVKLAFYKDKKWQYVIVEKNTLASKNKILQLANTGIEVNENNAKDMIIYLSSTIQMNTEVIPLNNAVTHLGWTEDGFVPYIKNYKFDGDKSFEGVFKDIRKKGDYELWKEKMFELRQSNEIIHFIIASSFASVLIGKVHINPFIVHLWGKSGTGKTVALMIAMSIWGNPGIGHLVKNLNSTNVGLERLSAFLNNLPFAGDELQAIKNKYSDFSELIYSLTQGEGKSRGNVDGGIQEQLKWNCLYLTTGEEPITFENSKEGVKNRVIEIEENEPIVEDGKSLVDFLLNNYGTAGEEFINVIPSDEYLIKRHNEICKELTEEKTTGKQVNALALIILADEIASRNIFYDEPLTKDQVSKYFTQDIDEAERIYNLISDCFYRNINKFQEDTTGELWGTFDADSKGAVISFYFIPSVLKEFLSQNNISFDGVKTKLLKGGYIVRDSANKYAIQKKIKNKNIRCIKFIVKEESFIDQLNQNQDMPF